LAVLNVRILASA